MALASLSPSPDPSPDEETPAVSADGRRRRGQDSRARIVAAMLDIIRDGEVSPSADQVAAHAGVSLRTVFRHFEDMDSLYREMSGVIEGELRAIAEAPFRSADWRERVVELIERRGAAFERITPFKQASEALRHRSKFLNGDDSRLVAALRLILERELPPPVAQDRDLVEILDALLGFETWSRLRRKQGLSEAATQAALEKAVRRLIA